MPSLVSLSSKAKCCSLDVFLSEDTHSLGRLVERNGSDVELLDLIDSADGQSAVVGQSQTVTEGRGHQHSAPSLGPDVFADKNRPDLSGLVPVGVSLGVERAHVVDLLQVDVREDQFVVAGVDDGGPVGAGEHVGGGERAEGAQNRGLSAQSHLLTLTQNTCTEPHTGHQTRRA